MTFSIEFADEQQEYQARIKVIGCGGSGGNAVNTMINFGLEGVEFIVVNTDAQALNGNAAPTKLQIGGAVTRGLGAGADPDRGRKAAMEDHQRIKELIRDRVEALGPVEGEPGDPPPSFIFDHRVGHRAHPLRC